MTAEPGFRTKVAGHRVKLFNGIDQSAHQNRAKIAYLADNSQTEPIRGGRLERGIASIGAE